MNKEEQKKLLIEVMELDEKDRLYDVHDDIPTAYCIAKFHLKTNNMLDLNHGIGTVIKEITTSLGTIKIGSKGILTAYLPEDDTYAIYFENGQWITFDKVSLDQYCEVELNDDYKNK